MSAVLRFAPSPNGYLHLGHAYSALVNQATARRLGGRLLLRMEDIDTERCRPRFITAIEEDLAWLGIAWERPVRRQSEHFSDYGATLEALRARELVYPCFCTRQSIQAVVADRPGWPRDPDGSPLYPGTCRQMGAYERARRLASGQHAALRLDMGRAMALAGGLIGWREYGEGDAARDVRAEPAAWGDAVLARKDIPASYHIAVVVDDALQGVTDVVRGQDLFDATSLHRLIQVLIDMPAPNYRHHDLLRDGSGQKLSKSLAAKSLRAVREEGATAADLRRRLGF